MGARDYDPRLGRWLSADTIVPEPGNPPSLNRFAYVYNNPLKYTDPSGHRACLEWDSDGQCMAWENGWGDVLLGVYSDGVYACGTLAECQGPPDQDKWGAENAGGAPDFKKYERISEDVFEELLEAVYQDMRVEVTPRAWPNSFMNYLWVGSWVYGYIPGALAGRGTYDTPLWNNEYEDLVICIEGHGCYKRSEVNYIAQGMWGAQSGESLEETLAVVNDWNRRKYHHPATEGELYWAAYGWRWYHERSEQETGE